MTDRYINRVQKLLERASHPNTPGPERDECLRKAKIIMEEQRIDHAMLNFDRSDEDKRKDVDTREYLLENHFEYLGDQTEIMKTVFRTSGCKVRPSWNGVTAVGYRHDLDVAEMLWLNIQADYIQRMFPSWNTSLSVEENIFTLKSAGHSWMDIVKMSWEADPESKLNSNSGSYMRSCFNRQAAKRGIVDYVHPRNPKKYRVSFSVSYSSRIVQRLREMERDSASARDESKSLAIVKDEDFLAEEFFSLFPEMRPPSEEELAAWQAAADARRKAEEERRANMTQAQRDAEDAREERRAERERRRYERDQSRRRPDMLAWRNGHDAANQVNLSTAEQFDVKEQLQ